MNDLIDLIENETGALLNCCFEQQGESGKQM